MPATAQEVQKLREMTGAGFLDCKKALESSQSIDDAIKFLREKGKASAAQKAMRTASEGLVCAWLSADQKKGSLVELNCETDFVARTKDFQDLVRSLAVHAGENNVQSPEALLSQNLKGSKDNIESVIKEKIGKLGENLKVKRVACFGGSGSLVNHYVHHPLESAPDSSKLAVMIEAKSDKDAPELKELIKDLAMQVAAASPKWVSKEAVPQDIVEKEKGIYLEQAKQSGKPEVAWPKITEGKLKDFFKQFCLQEQAFIKNPSTSVQELISSVTQKTGGSFSVKSFVRFKVGEE